jgi:type IV secretory pathway VirB6-like protein
MIPTAITAITTTIPTTISTADSHRNSKRNSNRTHNSNQSSNQNYTRILTTIPSAFQRSSNIFVGRGLENNCLVASLVTHLRFVDRAWWLSF